LRKRRLQVKAKNGCGCTTYCSNFQEIAARGVHRVSLLLSVEVTRGNTFLFLLTPEIKQNLITGL
jgi:hypothetical protein